MSKENAYFVLEEGVKLSCGVVGELMGSGFEYEKVTFYSDQGYIKAKYVGKFPYGQKEIDRLSVNIG